MRLNSVEAIQERGQVDFITCVGDDQTDESMFASVYKFQVRSIKNDCVFA